jgi:hypothetical protein
MANDTNYRGHLYLTAWDIKHSQRKAKKRDGVLVLDVSRRLDGPGDRWVAHIKEIR